MAPPKMSGPHAPTALGCPFGGGCHVSQPGMKALYLTDKLSQQASGRHAYSRSMFYGLRMVSSVAYLLTRHGAANSKRAYLVSV